jgi:Ala-tRNA(Pro) deacylase
MSTATHTTVPLPQLIDWLRDHQVEFELHEHATTFTARATARAEGVSPETFAKTIGVAAEDGRRFLLVLDATDHVDLSRARRLLNVSKLRLLREDELAQLAPPCDVGAIPPVPLWGVPIHADYAVRSDPEISFAAGTHEHSVRVDREGWERAAEVVYGDLAVPEDGRPIWARS